MSLSEAEGTEIVLRLIDTEYSREIASTITSFTYIV
jgi:hypothetical protein